MRTCGLPGTPAPYDEYARSATPSPSQSPVASARPLYPPAVLFENLEERGEREFKTHVKQTKNSSRVALQFVENNGYENEQRQRTFARVVPMQRDPHQPRCGQHAASVMSAAATGVSGAAVVAHLVTHWPKRRQAHAERTVRVGAGLCTPPPVRRLRLIGCPRAQMCVSVSVSVR